MKSRPIYVELDIKAKFDELWTHTQQPELHQKWDLRFSEIEYLPKEQGAKEQHFVYRTRIGFGLRIAGTGIAAVKEPTADSCIRSTLQFRSEQPISLIRQGGGYWSYAPDSNGGKVKFVTLYNYSTRFGAIGRLFDRIVFRPIFGFATAWSFDRLRIWLEESIEPSIVARHALIHYASVAGLLLMWLYMGLVPKLLFPTSGETAIMSATHLFKGHETAAVRLLGLLEIGFGLMTALAHRKAWSYRAQAIALLVLTAPVCFIEASLLSEPFNPLTTAAPMLALCAAAALTRANLPLASRCKRVPPYLESTKNGRRAG